MINLRFISLRFINLSKSCAKFQIPRRLMSNPTVRRAMLYVPGSDRRKIDTSLQLKVDCIAFDCEDSVAENRKKEARETIKEVIEKGNVKKSDPEWCVRINSVETGDLFLSDLDAILSATKLAPTIALPKVNRCEDLQYFSEEVWKRLVQRPENDRGPLNLILLIESARAIMTLPDLCQKAEDLATMAPIVPVALVFGYDDLLTSLGASRTTHGMEVLYARQKLVLVAKVFGLQAIDMVNLNPRDEVGLEKECREGAIMGFTGKQVIHPNQIPIVQNEFSPSRSQVRWANSIISHFEQFQEEGKGAFLHKGEMVDMPTVRRAKCILEAAKLTGKYKNNCS